MKKRYDLLLVGATALSAGICAYNAKNGGKLSIVVIEQGCTCAPEFSAALKGGRPAAPVTAVGAELIAELSERKAVDENGEVWLPAVSPVIAERFKDNADCYFFAALNNLEREGELLSVSFTAYGIEHRFKAGAMLDTTSYFITHGFLGAEAPELDHRLNYLVSDREGGILRRSFDCPDGDIGAARQALIDRSAENGERIIQFASELDVTPRVGSRFCLPSGAYGSFLEAFDAGALLAERGDLTLPETSKPHIVDDGEYDLIVAGMGTAGAIAAITAAGEGLRVLGIESLSLSGGSGTAGGIFGYYYGFKGGLYRKIDSDAHGDDKVFLPSGGIGPNQKVTALDRYARVRGVECRYRASFTSAEVENGRIVGIGYIQDGITHRAKAKVVIDCTAEASVCVAAGCAAERGELQAGRRLDGVFQPYSSVYFRTDGTRLGIGYIDNGTVDQYDPDDFGAAILGSATSYIHLRGDYSKRDYLGIAPLIGLREGRRLVGIETVCFENVINGRFTDKPVYYGLSNLDNHGKDSALEDTIYREWITICGLWGWEVSMPIPMGALISAKTDGLMAAGRNVSVDHTLATGLRMKDDCSKSGEAAAMIAALSIRDGSSPSEVDPSELRERLYASGCLSATDRVFLERQGSDEHYELPFWCGDDEKLADGIASDAPGYYLWSARALGKVGLLASLLDSNDPQTRQHAALAMSMLDKKLIPDLGKLTDILCDCAESRDGYVPKTGRKYLNLRSVSALCALERLAEPSCTDRLLTLLSKVDEIAAELPFEPYDLITDREDIAFQYSSHLITALSAIAAVSPRRGEIKSALAAFTEGRSFKVSLMNTHGFKLDRTKQLREY